MSGDWPVWLVVVVWVSGRGAGSVKGAGGRAGRWTGSSNDRRTGTSEATKTGAGTPMRTAGMADKPWTECLFGMSSHVLQINYINPMLHWWN